METHDIEKLSLTKKEWKKLYLYLFLIILSGILSISVGIFTIQQHIIRILSTFAGIAQLNYSRYIYLLIKRLKEENNQ